MTHQYTHTSNVAEFSKKGYLFTVVKHVKEPRVSGDSPTYVVTRNKIGETGEDIVQKDLSADEAMRYLAHCAEDGSLLKSEG